MGCFYGIKHECGDCKWTLWHAGAYQEPPLDPEHLITSAMTRTETQRRNRQIADSVLIKALKVALVSSARRLIQINLLGNIVLIADVKKP